MRGHHTIQTPRTNFQSKKDEDYATRHTFATNFYAQTKDIKAGAEALGVTEKTFLKYAKLMSNTVVERTNKIKFFADKKPTLVDVSRVTKVIE